MNIQVTKREDISIQDMRVLFDVISDLFDINKPSLAYSLMNIYDVAAESIGMASWMQELESK